MYSIVMSCAYDLDDKIKIANSFDTQEIISVDSELFNQINAIIKNDDDPNKTIACIDFIYPLTIFSFNENLEIISTSLINNDQEFSDLIGSLDIMYAISISFPITSVLDSGETLTINNKEELKEAIDECKDTEIVIECGTLISNCVWKIGYYYDSDNVYLAGIFQENSGFTTLTVNNSVISGSWSPFVIDHELHLNINLIDPTDIGLYFNKDWKAEYLDENSLKLTYENEILILNQRCDSDFNLCSNFNFEKCTEDDSDYAEFILDDYTFCIFDTLELNEEFEISYYETEEEAISISNPIDSSLAYINSENHQIIYVRIYDVDYDIPYYVKIKLIVTNC